MFFLFICRFILTFLSCIGIYIQSFKKSLRCYAMRHSHLYTVQNVIRLIYSLRSLAGSNGNCIKRIIIILLFSWWRKKCYRNTCISSYVNIIFDNDKKDDQNKIISKYCTFIGMQDADAAAKEYQEENEK